MPELKILIDAVQIGEFITDKQTAEMIDRIADLSGGHRVGIQNLRRSASMKTGAIKNTVDKKDTKNYCFIIRGG